ncbi:MAG: glycosyltransferase family 4 protein [gamma proteobacterium symbiont of Taylorina sp.]|nr:glycosyltransferase family 4 protein [gamma proteobacterium symbiont of Taylorina sp.]
MSINLHNSPRPNKSRKVLFLTAELPYPPVSGGKLKSWKLVEFLSKHYQLSVATILKENDEDHVHDFILACKLVNFYFASVKHPRNLNNLIISYCLAMPLNLYRTFSSYFKQKIKDNIHHYDLVICDHYEVFQYIPETYQGKIILHEHNAYFLMWERYAQDKHHSLSKRLVSFLEARRVKSYEKKSCMKADKIFASPNDIETLKSIGVHADKCRYTYHLGDDSQLKLAPIKFNNTSKSLLYIGSLGWEANIDGLLWFFEQIWPQLIKLHPDLIFTIIGKKPDQRLIDITRHENNIKFTGFVNDLEPYYQNHRIFVAPLRFGAGMKVKVLNAMCRGIPIVTTSVGSEGIVLENMHHIAIADDAENMILAINHLLRQADLWSHLQQNSRQLISEKYTWKSLFKDMKKEIDELLPESNSSTQNKQLINYADCSV